MKCLLKSQRSIVNCTSKSPLLTVAFLRASKPYLILQNLFMRGAVQKAQFFERISDFKFPDSVSPVH